MGNAKNLIERGGAVLGIEFGSTRIKAVLVEQDKSQKWLAEQLGKSFSTTNAYCCNRQQPNLDTLYRIAQLLSVELKELIVDNTMNEEV